MASRQRRSDCAAIGGWCKTHRTQTAPPHRGSDFTVFGSTHRKCPQPAPLPRRPDSSEFGIKIRMDRPQLAPPPRGSDCLVFGSRSRKHPQLAPVGRGPDSSVFGRSNRMHHLPTAPEQRVLDFTMFGSRTTRMHCSHAAPSQGRSHCLSFSGRNHDSKPSTTSISSSTDSEWCSK